MRQHNSLDSKNADPIKPVLWDQNDRVSEYKHFCLLCGVVMPFAKEAAGKAFYLSRKGKRFWLSMAYDKDIDALCEQEIKSLVKTLSDEQLQDVVIGYDLGVKRQVTGSNDTVFHLPDQAQERLQRLEQRKQRYQRRYASMARANDQRAGTKKRKSAPRVK